MNDREKTLDMQVTTLPLEILDRLRARIPLHIINDHLKSLNKATTKSWLDLSVKHADLTDTFKKILHETICYGRKTIYVYDLSSSFSESGLKPDSSFSTFPIDVPKCATESHTAYCYDANNRYTSLTYTIAREALETQNLTSSDLSESARSQYWIPSAVIRIQKPVTYTAFDSIIFDKESQRLYVAIDDLQHTTRIERADLLAQFIVNIDTDGRIRRSAKPINLFGSIKQMYSYADEGIVCQLSFECGTGAVRDEKLKQGQLDLRNEIYHVRGKAAVGELQPYKIEIAYQPSKYNKLRTETCFAIKGTRSCIFGRARIQKFEITSISGLEELYFLLNRLSLYTENEQA